MPEPAWVPDPLPALPLPDPTPGEPPLLRYGLAPDPVLVDLLGSLVVGTTGLT